MSKSQTVHAEGRPPRTARRRWTFRRALLVLLIIIAIAVSAAYLIPTTRWAEGPGYIMTETEAQLRPPVEGVIARIMVAPDQAVKAGDTIIQLRDDTYRMQWEEAKQEITGKELDMKLMLASQELSRRQRKEQLFQAKSKLALAKDELEKMRIATSGVFSSQELEKKKLEVELAESAVKELQLDRDDLMAKQLAVLIQDIEIMRKRVARLNSEVQLRRICAPIAGQVNLNRFEMGEVVKPEHVLGQIFDTDKWIVKLKIRERDIAHVKMGQNVEIALSAYPPLRHGYLSATVSRVVKIVTPQATGDGIFYVEAELAKDGDVKYHPGMTARARIDTGQTNWLFKLIGF